MRRIDPEFDIYELERDAKVDINPFIFISDLILKGIFRYVYNAFLHGDLTNIEKQCGDMALGYFRVLLKKRDVEVAFILAIFIPKFQFITTESRT